MITLGFWFLISLAFSAFFSAVEMAFVSSDRVNIREKADSGDRNARRVTRFYQDPHNFLTTILIGNNFANVLGTAILTYMMSEYFGIANEWVVTAIMAPLLLVFSEITPKEYSRAHSNQVLTGSALILEGITKLLSFFTKILMHGVDFFLKPLGGLEKRSIFVSEQEFRYLVEESLKTGVVGQHEKKIIDTILDFERMRVHAVMTPVDQAPKVELHASIKDVKAIARETGATMLLVYEEIPSIVVGMIYVFDLLFEEDESCGLRSFLRSPVFIRETTSCETAFFTLQQRRQSYAVVVDAQQEVIGAVPIERLLVF